jgi:hypothetical protein
MADQTLDQLKAPHDHQSDPDANPPIVRDLNQHSRGVDVPANKKELEALVSALSGGVFTGKKIGLIAWMPKSKAWFIWESKA